MMGVGGNILLPLDNVGEAAVPAAHESAGDGPPKSDAVVSSNPMSQPASSFLGPLGNVVRVWQRGLQIVSNPHTRVHRLALP